MGEQSRGKPTSLKERLAAVQQQAATAQDASRPCCISRVTQSPRLQLSPGDDTAYFPEVVSLGPYHFGQNQLVQMDQHKTRALSSVLTRTRKPLEYYLNPMYDLESQALERYDEPNDLNGTRFGEMLLLDGCFILEIIRGHNVGFDQLLYPRNDPVFSRRGNNNMANSIIKDMIKLENQIPFFVLEKLLHLQQSSTPSVDLGLVAQLASAMFVKWLTGENLDRTRLQVLDKLNGEFIHCLNVFQASLLLCVGDYNLETCRNDTSNDQSMTTSHSHDDQPADFFYSATDLIEYGIMFKTPKRERRSVWDIRFQNNGVLEIPRIFINNRFKVTFQNLITFEQQWRRKNPLLPMLTEYVHFMDKLINSATDVGHLHHAGIIVHQLRSDAEVANLFNDLGKAAFQDPKGTAHYSELYQRLNEHCNTWNQWKSELKRTYFGNPWAMASLFAAIILLLLGFFQTFYTIYPYYWPSTHS